jgi:type III secretion protein J
VTGCGVPVAGGAGESDANQIVVALERAHVDAAKEADPDAEGRFRIVVARDDVGRALAAMSAEGLPRPSPAGVLSSADKDALVPSRSSEHARLVAGLAGDLERTLEGVDGILAARVHLNLPEPDPFREATRKATASVLLEHRGPNAPLPVSEVQRLLAGGVAGLAPEDVAVVTVAKPAPARPDESVVFSHVGPIVVARTSARLLQATLVALLVLVSALAAATLTLYARLSRGPRPDAGDRAT